MVCCFSGCRSWIIWTTMIVSSMSRTARH